jgi:FMN phosphatase YigB (HAD superfamily)
MAPDSTPIPKKTTMTTPTSTYFERAVSDVRQAAFEIGATDEKQAQQLLREALKLQPGHADLLGDLAVLHLQAGRHAQCIQAASEALAADPRHDESAYAMALALEASGRIDEARAYYEDLATGSRAERFWKLNPSLAQLCETKLAQLGPAPAMRAETGPAPIAPQPSAPAPVATNHRATASDTSQQTEDSTVYAPMLVRPGALGQLLSETKGIQALTLDCFDTILWRHTDRPVDVFYDLQQRPAFKMAGIDAALREKSERHARQLQWVRTGRTEVTLDQIYLAARPGLSREMLRWLAEDELAAEMHACVAHPGAVRLLRDARARQMPVTIVSDTYFDAGLLRRLLAHALPADAYAAIGEIICSADHGACKSQGLFKLARLNQTPNACNVLHVGDNKDADVRAPGALGMSATYLMHEGDLGIQRRRMGATAVSLLDPSARASRPLHMPYRAVLATTGSDSPEAATAIGHATLGPLMHAFGRYLQEEATGLAATRDRVKLVFLLRDAHLPLHAYCAMEDPMPAYAAQISRFSAYAASFRRQENIDHYLAHFAQSLTLDMIARQLLLSPERTARLVEKAEASAQPLQTFITAVRQPEVLAEIYAASTAFRERLRRYLVRQVGLAPGDTIVLVDLGYAGTIQRVLGPVMSEEWGAEVFGRYMLAVGSVDEKHRGLMDQSWLDHRALAAMQPYVGVLETLCSEQGASVVGYDDEGQPIFESEQIDNGQSDIVFEIQAECLRFAREADAYFRAANRMPPSTILRDEALASFGRLLFFPSAQEIEHLAKFKLEINLGSGVARQLFDVDAGLEGLRQQGLFYVGQTQSGVRMSVPAELRAAGMELSLSLLAQTRFGLDVARIDWSTRKSPVQVLLMRDDRSAQVMIEATPTHDGYFSTVVPLPDSDADVGLALGRDHEWLQLHSAELVSLSGRRVAEGNATDLRPVLAFSGVRDQGHGLLHFEAADSLLMLPAGSWSHEGRAGLRIVFRPIAARKAAGA